MCMHKYIYIYIHTHTHTYTCTHMYTHVHTCTHMYTHVHTCTHMLIKDFLADFAHGGEYPHGSRRIEQILGQHQCCILTT